MQRSSSLSLWKGDMDNVCKLGDHEWVITTTFTMKDGEQLALVEGYCKICNITLKELEKEETPQNPEYRFKHLSEEPIG